MDDNEQILFSKTTYMLSPLRTFKSPMEPTHTMRNSHTFYKYLHRNKPSHSLAQRITPLNHIYNPFELATSPYKTRMSSYSYKPIRKINTISSFNRLSSSMSRHNLTYYDNHNNTDVINITMETPPCNNTKVRHSKASTLSEGENNNNNTNANMKVRNSINVIEILERENDSSKDDIYDAFDGEQLTIKKTITKKEENKVLEEYKRRVLDENNELTRGGKVNLNEDNINDVDGNDDNGDRGLFKGESIRKGIALNMDIVNQLLHRGDVKGNKECKVWEKIEEESSQRDCESYNTPRSDRKERVSRNIKRNDELSAMKKITEEKGAVCEDGEKERNEEGLGNESKEKIESGSVIGKKGNLKEDNGNGKDKEEWKMRKVRFKMKDENVNGALMDEEHIEQNELQDNIMEGFAKEEYDDEKEDNIQDDLSISSNNKDNKCNDVIKAHIEKQEDKSELANNKPEFITDNENKEETQTDVVHKEININQEKDKCDNQNENIKLNNDNDDTNKSNEQINEPQNKVISNIDPTTEDIVFPNKDNECNNNQQSIVSYNEIPNETNRKEFPDSLNEDIKLQHEYNDYMETIHEKNENENIVDDNEIQQHEELNTKSDIESYIELTKELNKRIHNNNDNKHFSNETSITKHNDNILPIQSVSQHKEQDKGTIESNDNIFTKEDNDNNNNQFNLSQTNTNEHNKIKTEIEYEHTLINESSHVNHQQFNIEDGMNVNNNNIEMSKDINDHHINKSHLLSHTETELHDIMHDNGEHCDNNDNKHECKDKLIFKHKNINKQQPLNTLSNDEGNDLNSNKRYYENEPHVDNDNVLLNNCKQTITEENERIPTNATVDIKKAILTSLDDNNNKDEEHQLLITPRKSISPKPKDDTIQTPSKPLTEIINSNPHPLIYKKQNSIPIKPEPKLKDKDELLKDVRMYNTDRDHFIHEEILVDDKERNKFVFATPGKQPTLEIKKLNIPSNTNAITNNNNNINSSSRFPSPRNESVLIDSIATPKKQSQIIYKRSPINKDTSKPKFTSEHEINVSPNKNHKTEITIKDDFNNNNCLLKKHSPKQPNTIPSSIIIPLCTNKELNSNIPKQLLLKQMKKEKELNNMMMLNSNEKIIKLNKHNSQTIINNNIDNNHHHHLIKTQQHDLSISRIQPVNIISKYKTQQHSPERVYYLTSNINSPVDVDNNNHNINNDSTSNHFIPVSKKYSFIKQTNTITTNDNTSRRHCCSIFNNNNNNQMHSHSQLNTISYSNTLSTNNNAQSTIDHADKFTINGTHTFISSKQGKLYSRNNKNSNTNRFAYKDVSSNTNSKATQTEMKYIHTVHTNNTRLKKYNTLTVNNDNELSRCNLSFYKCSTHRGRPPMTYMKTNDIKTNYISHTSLISQRSLDNDYSYSYNYTEKPFYTIQKDSMIKEECTDKDCGSKKGNCSKIRKCNNKLIHHVNTHSMKRGKDEVSKYKYQITINEEDCVLD